MLRLLRGETSGLGLEFARLCANDGLLCFESVYAQFF